MPALANKGSTHRNPVSGAFEKTAAWLRNTLVTENNLQLKVSTVRDLRESGDEALGSRKVIQKTGLSRARTKIFSSTEKDECHDLSDFPPAQAAGCQLDHECLENYDQWEFVVSESCRRGHERPHDGGPHETSRL